jgi:hypothetical protein
LFGKFQNNAEGPALRHAIVKFSPGRLGGRQQIHISEIPRCRKVEPT